MPALREAIRKADPDLAVTAIGTAPIAPRRPVRARCDRSARGALYLGGLTLLLSMVGLFGVQSHVVAHRTREIGVRMSVGATARQIKLMVFKDGYRPVIEGLMLGTVGRRRRARDRCAPTWSSRTSRSSIRGCCC